MVKNSPKIISVVILILFCITGCYRPSFRNIEEEIGNISRRLVPDRREGVFDVTVSFKSRQLILKGETNIPEAKAEILGLLQKKNIKFTDSLTILPDTLLIKKTWGLVSVSVCNIRSKPSHSSELASQALMGTPVRILKSLNGWFFIQTPDKYTGWLEDDVLVTLTDKEFHRWKLADRIIFTGKTGEIVSEGDESFNVSDVVAGSIIGLTGEDKEYYYVMLPDGRKGKAGKSYWRDFRKWAAEAEPVPERLYKSAISLMGIPYLWGGTSVKAMDCSGFVKTVYFLNGLILARDVSLQIRHGYFRSAPVSTDSLLAGDLLFFGTIRNGILKATHVGMYIGDTEYIHSSGMVKINSLDSARANFSRYRYNTLLGTSRISGYYPADGLQPVINHPWYFN